MDKQIHQKYVTPIGISLKGSPAENSVEELPAKMINYQKPPAFFGKLITYCCMIWATPNMLYTHSIHGISMGLVYLSMFTIKLNHSCR